MKSTLEGYTHDKQVLDQVMLDKFYDTTSMTVFIKPYGLACGYKDVWKKDNLEVVLEYSYETYRLTIQSEHPLEYCGLRRLDFRSRNYRTIHTKQKKYIAMLS